VEKFDSTDDPAGQRVRVGGAGRGWGGPGQWGGTEGDRVRKKERRFQSCICQGEVRRFKNQIQPWVT